MAFQHSLFRFAAVPAAGAGALVLLGSTSSNTGVAALEEERETEAEFQVRRAVILIRHGDRTPCVSSDRIGRTTCARSAGEKAFFGAENKTLLPDAAAKALWTRYSPFDAANIISSSGRLTHLGAAQQLANGIWLRERYVTELGLLPPRLDPVNVHCRSTPFPRCVESAQNLLLGLYPVHTRILAEAEAATVVAQTPIHTRPVQLEPMYGAWFCKPGKGGPAAGSCPRLFQVLAEVYGAEKKKGNDDDDESAFAAAVTAQIGSNPHSDVHVADAIRCQHQYSLPFMCPSWTREEAWRVRTFAYETFARRFLHPEFLALMISQFAEEFLSGLSVPSTRARAPRSARTAPHTSGGAGAAGDEEDVAKVTIFSGHDACPMLPFLVASGVYDGKTWPDYASLLVFEVGQFVDGSGGGCGADTAAGTADLFHVRALLNGERREIECGTQGEKRMVCPLDDFKRMLRAKVVPAMDLKAACAAAVVHKDQGGSSGGAASSSSSPSPPVRGSNIEEPADVYTGDAESSGHLPDFEWRPES